MKDETQSQSGRIILGALSAIAIVLIGLFFLPEPAPEPQTVASVNPEETAEASAVEPAVSDPPVADPEPAQDPEPETPMGPQFDTFRIEPDGSMLIAGRTEPGQDVSVILGGETIARVTADASGSFVIFAEATPSDVPRRLSLLGDPDAAKIASQTSYMVAPIQPVEVAEVAEIPPASPQDAVQTPDAPAAVAEAQAETPTAQDDVAALPGEIPATATPEPVVAAVDVPDTPTVLQTDADGITVVQTTAQLVPNVALDAITYDPQGEILLSGRATGDGAIEVYLDNRPLTTSPVSEGGSWRIDLPDVDTGIYTLRIDEVDEEGTVVSRIETPFKREEAEDVAAVLAEETAREGFEVAVKTVQPGATLWAIAEENLGKGIYYVEVFEANRDLIKDPDLIYPGQIFRIPDSTQ